MANETGNDSQAAAGVPAAPAEHSPWDFNISHTSSENVQVHGGTVTDTSREQTDVHAHVSDYFAHAAAGTEQSTTAGLSHGFEHTHNAFQTFDLHEAQSGPALDGHFAFAEHGLQTNNTAHHDAFADTHHAALDSYGSGSHGGHDTGAGHGGHDAGAGHGGGSDHGGTSHDQGIGGM